MMGTQGSPARAKGVKKQVVYSEICCAASNYDRAVLGRFN
jgi:hypothetical protein